MQITQHPETLALRREFFTGSRDKDVFDAMDVRRAELESQGERFVKRTKIGRNATCPCGSGRKFKKCCIFKAKQAERVEQAAQERGRPVAGAAPSSRALGR